MNKITLKGLIIICFLLGTTLANAEGVPNTDSKDKRNKKY